MYDLSSLIFFIVLHNFIKLSFNTTEGICLLSTYLGLPVQRRLAG